MLQKQAGHNLMGHVTLAPGVSPVRPRRGAHYGRALTCCMAHTTVWGTV